MEKDVWEWMGEKMSGQFDPYAIERGVAQGAHTGSALTNFARKGLIDFLRAQVVDAEWEIARHKARIAAYESAIAAIQEKTTSPA